MTIKIISALAALAMISTPLQAQDSRAAAQDGFSVAQGARTYADVVGELQDSGYIVDAVTQTFLGRIRITARNAVQIREIIMSRSTGEIMSDSVSALSGAQEPRGSFATGFVASNGIAGGNALGAETGATASGGISQAARANNGSDNMNADRGPNARATGRVFGRSGN